MTAPLLALLSGLRLGLRLGLAMIVAVGAQGCFTAAPQPTEDT